MTASIEQPRSRVQLALEGMTCASRATRIERKLKVVGRESEDLLAAVQRFARTR